MQMMSNESDNNQAAGIKAAPTAMASRRRRIETYQCRRDENLGVNGAIEAGGSIKA